jgi:hypothetical protein
MTISRNEMTMVILARMESVANMMEVPDWSTA